MASVGVIINANGTISVDNNPVVVKQSDSITWNVTDDSGKNATVNIGSWQLAAGNSTFANPFSKSGDPSFVVSTAASGGTGKVTSSGVQAEFDTTWNYTLSLSGQDVSLNGRVIISGTQEGDTVKSREVY